MPTVAAELIEQWPEESREAAQLVVDTYGEPHESTEMLLHWNDVWPWKRVLASRTYHEHHFPIPHIDSVESVVDYQVPPGKFPRWRSSTAVSSSSARPVRCQADATTSRPTFSR